MGHLFARAVFFSPFQKASLWFYASFKLRIQTQPLKKSSSKLKWNSRTTWDFKVQQPGFAYFWRLALLQGFPRIRQHFSALKSIEQQWMAARWIFPSLPSHAVFALLWVCTKFTSMLSALSTAVSLQIQIDHDRPERLWSTAPFKCISKDVEIWLRPGGSKRSRKMSFISLPWIHMFLFQVCWNRLLQLGNVWQMKKIRNESSGFRGIRVRAVNYSCKPAVAALKRRRTQRFILLRLAAHPSTLFRVSCLTCAMWSAMAALVESDFCVRACECKRKPRNTHLMISCMILIQFMLMSCKDLKAWTLEDDVLLTQLTNLCLRAMSLQPHLHQPSWRLNAFFFQPS